MVRDPLWDGSNKKPPPRDYGLEKPSPKNTFGYKMKDVHQAFWKVQFKNK
jgi:hypothetical protein